MFGAIAPTGRYGFPPNRLFHSLTAVRSTFSLNNRFDSKETSNQPNGGDLSLGSGTRTGHHGQRRRILLHREQLYTSMLPVPSRLPLTPRASDPRSRRKNQVPQHSKRDPMAPSPSRRTADLRNSPKPHRQIRHQALNGRIADRPINRRIIIRRSLNRAITNRSINRRIAGRSLNRGHAKAPISGWPP
jgi:hypothetical protein